MPIIRTVTDYVKSQEGSQTYHILLILTDGDIHDMQETKDMIVANSNLPFAIIIVGVGNSSFDLMVELDSDDALLRDSVGRAAARDIVQFVKFNDFKGGDLGRLSQEVLQEVPDQIVGYMSANGIYPPDFKE